MKVTGRKVELCDFEIDLVDTIMEFREKWMAKVGKGEWINGAGTWEKEYHTSHSWSSEEGKATDEELEIWNAFFTLIKIARETDK